MTLSAAQQRHMAKDGIRLLRFQLYIAVFKI